MREKKTITYHGSGHAHLSPEFCESVHGLLHDESEALCGTNTKHDGKDIKLKKDHLDLLMHISLSLFLIEY